MTDSNIPRLLGYRCILDDAGLETLVGKYGMIWPMEDKYAVMFWSPRVAAKWDIKIAQDEEHWVLVDEKQAKAMRKSLKTYRSLESQTSELKSRGGL
jgi:hypothetical protein